MTSSGNNITDTDSTGKTTFSQRDLRGALSNFATGVTIVTTTDAENGEPMGMTASSFNSVSMDPPLILWSVTKDALSAPLFQSAKHFAVHVLGSNQVDLSNRFASRGADKFSGIDYQLNEQNIPIFSNALSCFECSTWAVYEGGDHWIIVGKVEALTTHNGEGLVFSSGSYATATAINPPKANEKCIETSDATVDNLLFYNLSRAYRQMSNRFHSAVRENGLTLAEWRILASLHGNAARDLADLSARTFINPMALADKVHIMQEAGLCQVREEQGVIQVAGTQQGHDRVNDLFALGTEQEAAALQGANSDHRALLIDLLKQIIGNTNRT